MLTLKAPAKINWFLNVLGTRNDGFHEIQSLIQKVTLYDTLSFSPSADIELRTEAPVPVEENLVFRAAMLLKKMYGINSGAMMTLRKEIPMGAGLGGGSSDAAAALIGLSRLWSLDISIEELGAAAAQLGSDVPFFLYGPMGLALGRGEKIIARKAVRPLDMLLVKPDFSISTAWAYKKLSEKRSGKNEEKDPELTKKTGKVNNIEHFIRSIERAELGGLAVNVSNDLESVAIESFPAIAEIKDRLLAHGAEFSLMSGSGSVVFGVFGSREKAVDASAAFDGFWTAAVQTIVD